MGRLTRAVVREWQRLGVEPPMQVVDPYGPNVTALSPFYLLRASGTILLARLAGRALLLHVHMASRGSVLRKSIVVALGRALRLPVILHLHLPDDFLAFRARLPRPLRDVITRILGSADRVVVLGRRWVEPVAEALGLPHDRMRVVINGAPDPGAPRRPDAAAAPRIVFLGRLEASKGLPELLQALASPRLRAGRWSACVAGRGDAVAVRRRVEELGLGDRVVVPGWLDEQAVRELLRESDIFVLPSRDEGLSIAMIEAMAAGLALVVTPAGAAAEIVEDGREGKLVPIGDAVALGTALADLVEDGDSRRRMGTAARARFESGLDTAAHCRALMALYAELLATPPTTIGRRDV